MNQRANEIIGNKYINVSLIKLFDNEWNNNKRMNSRKIYSINSKLNEC